MTAEGEMVRRAGPLRGSWVLQIKKGPLGDRSFRETLRFGRPRTPHALSLANARSVRECAAAVVGTVTDELFDYP